jgi:lipoprotein-anchoring transpeptidase ErfK/SrfK
VLLILVVIVGLLLYHRHRSRKPREDEPEALPPIAELVAVPEPAGVEPAPVPPPPPLPPPRPVEKPADVGRALAEAQSATEKGHLVRAREIYLSALKHISEEKLKEDVENRIGRINLQLVMTPSEMPEKAEYIVRRGDYLQKIAKKFGTTAELIGKSNGIKNPNLIKAGDRLRIFTANLAIVVNSAQNELTLYANGKFFKQYPVGTGKFDRTPTGTFVITEKIKEPVWWRPNGKEIRYGHPENILGTRWMTLRATGDTPKVSGYGIHGTWDENTIGRSESAGCIRMKNRDVEELFALVPLDTPVTITR